MVLTHVHLLVFFFCQILICSVTNSMKPMSDVHCTSSGKLCGLDLSIHMVGMYLHPFYSKVLDVSLIHYCPELELTRSVSLEKLLPVKYVTFVLLSLSLQVAVCCIMRLGLVKFDLV